MGLPRSSRVLAEFRVASVPGNERLAASRVVEAVSALQLDERRLSRLQTAVAEATLNAMEHGNGFRAEQEVEVRVELAAGAGAVGCSSSSGGGAGSLCVSITDHGSGPVDAPEVPDLQRKLEGEQSPRGWGLFLMRHMVDEVSDETQQGKHTLHLRLAL